MLLEIIIVLLAMAGSFVLGMLVWRKYALSLEKDLTAAKIALTKAESDVQMALLKIESTVKNGKTKKKS